MQVMTFYLPLNKKAQGARFPCLHRLELDPQWLLDRALALTPNLTHTQKISVGVLEKLELPSYIIWIFEFEYTFRLLESAFSERELCFQCDTERHTLVHMKTRNDHCTEKRGTGKAQTFLGNCGYSSLTPGCHPHLCPVLGHFVGCKKRRRKAEAQGGGGMYLTLSELTCSTDWGSQLLCWESEVEPATPAYGINHSRNGGGSLEGIRTHYNIENLMQIPFKGL